MTDSSNARQRLIELARRTTAPTVVRKTAPSSGDIDAPEFDVAPGQIWVGRQQGRSALLVILEVNGDRRTAVAAPLSIEPGIEAADTLVVGPGASPLALTTVIWFDLKRAIPVRVLSRPLGKIAAPIFDLLTRTALNSQQVRQISDVRLGAPDYDVHSSNARVKADLEDLFELWASSLEPIDTPDKPITPPSSTLPVQLAQVVEMLGVPQPIAMAIIRRERPLTPDELARLAAGTGISEADLQPFEPSLPPELLIELEQPRWRLLVETTATSEGIDELTARRQLSQSAYELAARQRGDDTSLWRHKLRMVAYARLDNRPLEQLLVSLMPMIFDAAPAQAAAMLKHLESLSPGAATRLHEDPFAELESWDNVRVRRVPELDNLQGGVTAEDCSVSGSYDGALAPPTMVVTESLSHRRQCFTLLHELGHHLQQHDLHLGQAVLKHEHHKAFEDAACDAFAAEILLPSPMVEAIIAEHGTTVEAALELYRRTTASRAAICVRLAEHVCGPGVVAVIEPSGTVSFASAHGNLYPPRRGSDQRANPLVEAALANQRAAQVVRRDNALIQYSTGHTSAELYGQAAWCDGLLFIVMVEHSAPWRAFAPPREGPALRSAKARWGDCGVCNTNFEITDRCPTCREPRCPEGHCECTLAAERRCGKCFLMKHRTQFETGSTVCKECCE
ncbi:ImmA/IrrE family metallo-endopeptidase [Glycomyces sp. YM15]|uniref:ImmA/IrrE family metallo-endopeptidase n=1 Tax=Glycomyces sp. YM15 TaxID=2800446 RepID=UPI0019663852|nr:ImmA/IrrE family metallo-endopeptidase [Glycomyces sp. YM15]